MILTEEQIKLLLEDLSARLLYGVICRGICKDFDVNKDEYVDKEVTGILTGLHIYKCSYGVIGLTDRCDIESIRPYLRPMESMTEEEEMEFEETLQYTQYTLESYIWLNKNHFDYRRGYDEKSGIWKTMIELGLAIPAPEGMYNF